MEKDLMEAATLRIGDVAPNFWARSTAGQVALEDYRGRWVMLISHPGDFTPVCTSEFIAFAEAKAEFAAIDTVVLALSVDSLFAHLAWVRAIRDLTGVIIDFPIIEDPSLAIAQAFGMLSRTADDTATVRASIIIDPEGIVRAITYYPAIIGRSVDESLRMLKALQVADRTALMAPQGWRPGQPLLRPPGELGKDVVAGDAADWFYRFEDKY